MITALLMTALLAATPEPQALADLILVSSKIWTGNPANPEAEALAVKDGRIVAVGRNAEISKLKGPKTIVLEGKGRRVVPGLIDCHTHMSMGGLDLLAMDLRKTKDPAEFTSTVAEYAKKQAPGIWLTDGAWDHEQWTPPRLPTKADLDSATGDHPSCLQRQDGHMMVCNSLALKLGGVDKNTPDPAGGVIVRDAAGNPTGVLKDEAMSLVWKVRPPRTKEEIVAGLKAAVAHAAKNGVTSVQDLPGDDLDLPAWDEIRRSGGLTVRVNYRPSIVDWPAAKKAQTTYKQDDWLKVGGVKGFMDGALGAGTAVMFEAYADDPGNTGKYAAQAIPLSKIEERIKGADAAGLQVEVHAIGDKAIAELFDIYARVAQENGPKDRRFRIEHAQHLSARRDPDVRRAGRDRLDAALSRRGRRALGGKPHRLNGAARSGRTLSARCSTPDATVAFGSDWTSRRCHRSSASRRP